MTVENWRSKGEKVTIFNNEFFVIDDKSDKKTLLILHGYACSSYDYYKILPELSKEYRVVIPDLISFGSSTKFIERYFTVLEQADAITELLKTLGIKEVSIFAHDYGASVASELISRKNSSLINFNIQQLILSNYYLPQEYFIEEKDCDSTKKSFTKSTTSMLFTYSFFKKNKEKSLFKADILSDEDFKNMWSLHTYNDGIDIIDFIANYDNERNIFWDRWMNALKYSGIKTKIFWGEKDIFNDVEIIEMLAANIEDEDFKFIKNCGYYPMLEKPVQLSEFILNS